MRARYFSVDSTGEVRITRFACCSDSAKIDCCSGPMVVSKDMTTASRSGSMGGLVTWANCWRNQSKSGRCCRESTAMGVSSPMEPTASWPVSASGRSSWSRSSRLTWYIFMAMASGSPSSSRVARSWPRVPSSRRVLSLSHCL